MPDDRIKVAVVGVGQLGQHHARIYSELEEADLRAVVDIKPERAREVATRSRCAALTSLDDLPVEIQAVSLATPTVTHADLGCRLLQKGISVLVEKPMAHSLEAAEALEKAAEKGTVLQVGHSERFNPALLAVQQYVATPLFFEGHRLGVFVSRSLDVDVVLDLMIHDVDLVLYLTGSSVTDIRPVGIPVLTPRVDIANARLELENGCVANLTASRVSRERIRKLRFFQRHDYISLDFHEHAVEMYSLVGEGSDREIIQRTPEVSRVEPLKAELQAFLRAVAGDSDDRSCTSQQGRRALSVALDIIAGM